MLVVRGGGLPQNFVSDWEGPEYVGVYTESYVRERRIDMLLYYTACPSGV